MIGLMAGLNLLTAAAGVLLRLVPGYRQPDGVQPSRTAQSTATGHRPGV